jgi:hypothetical protein
MTQALARIDGRAETQHLGGPGRVGDYVAHVATAVLPGDDRGQCAIAGIAQCGGYFEDRDGPPRADVDRGEAVTVSHSRDIRGGYVVDVDEVAHLTPVFENLWWFAFFD